MSRVPKRATQITYVVLLLLPSLELSGSQFAAVLCLVWVVCYFAHKLLFESLKLLDSSLDNNWR